MINMRKIYAARSVAKKHIVEQCENCILKKNNIELYNHYDIMKVQETVEGKLNEVFLDHETGLGMISLLEDKDNTINQVTTNQMISADNVLNKSRKESATATALAKKNKDATKIAPTITAREEAKRKAERQNITNQTIVGTKEGIIDVLK